MAITIVIANTKGGSDKTTTTQLVAGELALSGFRVLVVALDAHNPGMMTYFLSDDEISDVDPMRTSCRLLEYPHLSYKDAVWNFNLDLSRRAGNGIKPEIYQRVARERGWQLGKGVLHVIPDCYQLAQTARDIPELAEKYHLAPNELLLTALTQAQNDYDYILLDTPPARPDMDDVSGNAMMAADAVVLPMRIDRLTVSACREDVRRIQGLSRKRKTLGRAELPILGISIQQFFPGDPDHAKVIQRCRNASFAQYLFGVMLPFDLTVSKAQFASELSQLFAPTGEVAKVAPLLAQEVITRAQSLAH